MAIDKNSDTWAAVEKWAKEQYRAAHQVLEDSPDKETERARGEIALLKRLFALVGKPNDSVLPDADNYGMGEGTET